MLKIRHVEDLDESEFSSIFTTMFHDCKVPIDLAYIIKYTNVISY